MSGEDGSLCPYCNGARKIVEGPTGTAAEPGVTCPWCLGTSSAQDNGAAGRAKSVELVSTEYCSLLALEPVSPSPYSLIDFLRSSVRFIGSLPEMPDDRAQFLFEVWAQTLAKLARLEGTGPPPKKSVLMWLVDVYKLAVHYVYGPRDEDSGAPPVTA